MAVFTIHSPSAYAMIRQASFFIFQLITPFGPFQRV